MGRHPEQRVTGQQIRNFRRWIKGRRMEDESSTYKSLRAWILQLPGVKEAPHRVGGIEFQVGGVEFMHSHGPTSLDIRLSKEDQASVLKTGLASPTEHWCTAKLDGLPSKLRTCKIW